MDRDRGPIESLFDDGNGDDEDEDEWRFSVAEVGPNGDGDGDGGNAGTDPDADGPIRGPIEPESVSPEHAAFVIAGAVLTLGVVLSAL